MAAPACAQSATVEQALRSLGSRAGVVFRGQVSGIVRSHDVVRVTFRVEEAVSGAVPGQFTLREWAGLWTDAPRYWVGESALVFALPPGAAGLDTTVDGMDGVVPIVAAGSDPSEPVQLDTSRLAATVLRPMGSALPTSSRITMNAVHALLTPPGERPLSGPPPRLNTGPEPVSERLKKMKSVDAVRSADMSRSIGAEARSDAR
jgi:hypothetical protein